MDDVERVARAMFEKEWGRHGFGYISSTSVEQKVHWETMARAAIAALTDAGWRDAAYVAELEGALKPFAATTPCHYERGYCLQHNSEAPCRAQNAATALKEPSNG